MSPIPVLQSLDRDNYVSNQTRALQLVQNRCRFVPPRKSVMSAVVPSKAASGRLPSKRAPKPSQSTASAEKVPPSADAGVRMTRPVVVGSVFLACGPPPESSPAPAGETS